MRISKSDGETVGVGNAASSELTVRAADENGAVVSGVAVTFLVTGGGSVGSMVDTTDADVLTSVTYIAGGTAGRACHYHNNPKTLKTIISFIFIS